MFTASPAVRRTSVGLATITAALTAAAPASASSSGESITEYATEAEINPDGTVSIVESITYDFASNSSPGLYREIPLVLDDGIIRQRRIEIEDVEVSSPSGADSTIDGLSEERGNLVLLVGEEDDPSTDVTGEQTYDISYTVHGALTEFDDYDEFYWDFVGTEWEVPKDNISVEITAPEITNVDCYAGDEGTDSPCESAEHDETTATMDEPYLFDSDGLTAAVALPKGAVDVGEPIVEVRPSLRPSLLFLLIAGACLVAVVFVAAYRKFRTSADRNAFNDALPPAMGPALAGQIHNATMRSGMFLAMVVQLEERGIISSELDPHDPFRWLFTLRRDPNGPDVSPPERELIAVMFRRASTTDLKLLAKEMTPKKAAEIRKMVLQEGVPMGLWSHGKGAVKILAVLGLFGLAAYVFVQGLEGAESGLLIAVTLLVTAILVTRYGRVTLFSRYGSHVHGLLKQIRKDTITGGPRSVAQYPSWAVALDVENNAVEGAPDLIQSHQWHGRHRPYYYDHAYRRSWNDTMRKSITPRSSSSGGSGSFGGGSVGGGGGGGGGGSR
ncbi:putative membrane protein YgcG [Lipingzhangella halophila]|uniref:Putative membrane protein YgcG n=1 Tax=Lipingzhangella halophila TaxID=1783352 RepID=A0A7W7W1W5_9ACTN|nr:DUF2207 domain-containing protein [Lipingzhangella halophila]MBB4931422.1 putative membrane protein YgcG [Lipingzhangella halophila]